MKFLIGQKKNMTQVFKSDGTVVPVTKVYADPSIITQIKTEERDGYSAIQFGSGLQKKRLKKPQQGHMKGLKNSKMLREFRCNPQQMESMSGYTRGTECGVDSFRPGDKVRVTGTSKGKGFQGVVKRHGFSGGPATHGNKDQHRMPGSIGSVGPAHVFKGKKMPGRMGSDRVTVSGLEIIKVEPEKNTLYIKGSIPGSYNGDVVIFGGGTFKPLKGEEQTKEVEKDAQKQEPSESDSEEAEETQDSTDDNKSTKENENAQENEKEEVKKEPISEEKNKK